MSKKIVAIVGSYRKDGPVDLAVEAILAGAREKGATTRTIYLTEQHIEFTRNCRSCAQTPGAKRGKCPQQDDMNPILEEIEAADAVVLSSPVSCYNVTAIFRRFMERMLGVSYWPLGQRAPSLRKIPLERKAVLVASSAIPRLLIPVLTGAPRALRMTAKMLGAKTVDTMWLGKVAGESQRELSPGTLAQARRLGWKLA
ncbi:MAG: flavodoxin family protein [Terracidiphilus sp.]